jgi:hypothetical protein
VAFTAWLKRMLHVFVPVWLFAGGNDDVDVAHLQQVLAAAHIECS